MLKLNTFFRYYIYRAYSTIADLFYRAYSIEDLFTYFDLLEHIFEHINAPLSVLYYNTEKCRSKD